MCDWSRSQGSTVKQLRDGGLSPANSSKSGYSPSPGKGCTMKPSRFTDRLKRSANRRLVASTALSKRLLAISRLFESVAISPLVARAQANTLI